MAKSFSELQTLAIQIRDELNKKKNSAQRVGSALLDIIDNCIQNITDIKQKLSVFEHACSGFKRVSSEAQLPVTPSQEDLAKGFLVNTSLYLYVGTGGNAVNGRYFNVGDIRGPQGEPGSKGETGNTGPTGEKGEQGNSGVTGDTSDIVVINNLDGGESEEGSIKVLAAEQGKVLNKKYTELNINLKKVFLPNSFSIYAKKDLLFKAFYAIQIRDNSYKERKLIISKLQHTLYEGGYIDLTISDISTNAIVKVARFYGKVIGNGLLKLEGKEINDIESADLYLNLSEMAPNIEGGGNFLDEFEIVEVGDSTYNDYGLSPLIIHNDSKKLIESVENNSKSINSLSIDVPIQGTFEDKKKITISGVVTSEGANLFGIMVFDVKEGDVYRIKTEKLGSTGSSQYAIYSSSDFTSNNLLQKGSETGLTALDEVVTIPKTALKLVVQYKINVKYTAIYKRGIESFSNYVALPYRVQYYADKSIKVAYKYNKDKDIVVELCPVSVNKTTQIKSFGFKENGYPYPIGVAADDIKPTSTDWIGPISFWAGTTVNSDNYNFTGGWHGSNGDQTGNPTSRTDSVLVFVDGKQIEVSGDEILGNECRIIVTNYIKSANTIKTGESDGKETLKEEVTYLFKDNKIYVRVVMTPIKDVTVFKYYGMQIPDVYNGKIMLIGDEITEGNITNSVEASSLVHIMAVNNQSEDYINAVMDNSLGLGKGTYSGDKFAFSSNNKAYYNLIAQGQTFKKKTNEKFFWRGYYMLSQL